MEKQICFGCMEEIAAEGVCPKCGFDPAAYTVEAHHLIPGTLLRERYSVGKVLGEGGFGITYVGRDTVLDLKVAIKEFYMSGYVNRNTTHSTTVQANTGNYGETFAKNREKFLGEARVLAKFANEEGIVGIRDYFQENNTAYIVMDFLSGETLRQYIEREGKLPAEKVIDILSPVIKSLGNVHSHNVIHRDISPDNIMLTDGGKVKLLDFGAAREVSNTDMKSLSIILKPGYAPEEQYRSKGHQGPWTDIYAMCATVYRCVTGTVPDDSMERMFEDKLAAPISMDCECSPAMSNVIMKGLAVRLADRYQSIEELLADMARAKAEPDNTAIAASPSAAAPAVDPNRTVFVGAEPATQKADPNATVFAAELAPDPAPAPAPAKKPEPRKPDPKKPESKKPEPKKPEPKKPAPAKTDAAKPAPAAAEAPKKSKKKLLIGIIAAAAVVVIGIVAGGIAMISSIFGDGGANKGEYLESMPILLSNYSVNMNSVDIKLPTTFAELEANGWICSNAESLEKEVSPNNSYGGSLELTNGYGNIDVYYLNYSNDTLKVSECDIFEIHISRYDYFNNYMDENVNTLTLPGGLVLSESTEKDFKASFPKGYSIENSYTKYYTYAVNADDFYSFGFDDGGLLSYVELSNKSILAAEEHSFKNKAPKYDEDELLASLNGFSALITSNGFEYPTPVTVGEYIDMGYALEKAPAFLASNAYDTAYFRADTLNTLEVRVFNPYDDAVAIEHCFVAYIANYNAKSESDEQIFVELSFDYGNAVFSYELFGTVTKDDFTNFLTENGIEYQLSGDSICAYITADQTATVSVYFTGESILSSVVINTESALREYLGNLE